MKVFRLWLAALATVVIGCGGAAASKAPAKDGSHTPQIALAASPARAATGYAPDGWGGLEVAPGEALPVTSADPTWGSPSAPVTVVEFADLQCVFCARAAVTMLALREMYGPEKLRIVWKHKPLPMHENAEQAANLGAAIFLLGGNEAFFTYVDGIYAKLLDRPEGREFSELAIESAAHAAEKAPDRIGGPGLRDTAEGPGAAKVRSDDELSERMNVSGTPAFFVNGVRIAGAQPLERFQAVIDDELERSQKALAAGTPSSRIYAARLADNIQSGRADKPKPASVAKAPDDAVWKVPVGTSPVRGKATAAVTLVVFADFQCPFCKKSSATIDELRAKYKDDLRVVFKHEPLPFHERADPAAEIAIEAYKRKGNDGFWKVHDALFASTRGLDDIELSSIATAAGLDGKSALALAAKHKNQAVIDEDGALADDVDAHATPTFFVNGKRLEGSRSLDQFSTVIDAELASAKAKIASGTPASEVYETLMKDARSASVLETKKAPAVGSSSPTRGGGIVTVQIFSDFQCPFCKRVEPTIADLEKAFPGKLRIVWRNRPLPMHDNAEEAAEAALEARKQKGNAGFWKMHDLMFAAQDHLDRAGLEEMALQAGLDAKRFRQALDQKTHQAEIDADGKIADDLDIHGTPSVLVNDVFVSGAQPLGQFKRAVRAALAKSK